MSREHVDAALASWSGQEPIELIGPPGIGKSTLARAWSQGRSVVWTDLLGVVDEDAVLHALAVTLGVDDSAQAFPALAARRPAAWVIDDAEEAAHALRALQVRMPPEVPILLTSRGRVGLRGARIVDVGPLGPAQAEELFVSRARAARADFDPERHRPAIASICERLDGLPLAIELAAARTRLVAPEAMLERLGLDDLRDLKRQGRHQSLRAALKGAVDTLSADARVAFAGCAAFRGPFTLDAFEACRVGRSEALEELLDAGLVQPTEGGALRLLHPVRAFASELPAEPGVGERVARWILDEAEQRSPTRDGPWWDAWRLQLEAAVREGGVEGARAALALARREEHCGPIGLQQARVARLGPLDDLPGDLASRLHRSVAVEALVRNDFATASQAAQFARDTARTDVALADALITWAQVLSDTRTSPTAPGEVLERALALAKGHPTLLAHGLLVRSVDHMRLGDPTAACRDARAAQQAITGHDDPDLEALCLAFLADAERRADVDAAQRLERLDQATALPIGSEKYRALVAIKRATALADCGRAQEAIACLEGPARRMEEAGDRLFAAGHRLHQAAFALVARDLTEAEARLASVPADLPHYAGVLVQLRRAQVLHALGDLEAARADYHAVAARDEPGFAAMRREATSFLAALEGGEAQGPYAELLARAHDGPVLGAWVESRGRWELRLLASLIQPPVRVAADGAWFSVGASRHHLGRKVVLIRVLAGLARRAREPVPLDDVLAFGWPGESPAGTSGRARVHVAISTLRKLGLQGALWTVPGDEPAYVLDAEVVAPA